MKSYKAILVYLIPPDMPKEDGFKQLLELENLLETFGGVSVIHKVQKKGMPNYKTYIGSGKAEEVLQDCRFKGANLVIINNILKPQQIFNLTEMYQKDEIEVWDRVDLILKIFAKHAVTAEAKLQIELAAIKHMGPRIFNMGIELSQQGGGIGTRGKGETNTEIMKRHLRKQELNIRKKLKHYDEIHSGHMKQRRKKGLQTVAIVGYTNAGKSTLMNTLTKKGVLAENALFATLDSRVGKVYLPGFQSTALVSDTIGFIRNMPPDLIDAFKSTLKEAIDADVLLHVIDITDEDMTERIEIVEEILDDLGVHDTPKVYVFNKIDKLENELVIEELKETYKEFTPVFISAAQKINFESLLPAIEDQL